MDKEELAEAKEVLEGLNSEEWVHYDQKALDIVYSWQQNDNYGDFINEDVLDEMVKREAEDGVQRLLYFLQGVEKYSPYGYRIDAYGNAKTVDLGDLRLKLEDIIEDNEE